MTPVRPLVTHMDFVCAKCGSRTTQAFTDGVYVLPTKCSGDGCRSRTFAPHRASARCVDWQKIRLQELLGADKAAEGQVPRSVEVELCGDLVHGAVVGDVVTVVGIVKVMATGDDLGKFAATGSTSGGGPLGGPGGFPGGGGGGGGGGAGGRNGSSLFLMYLEAVSLSRPRQQLQGEVPLLGDSSAAAAGLPAGPSALPSFITRDLAFVVTFCERHGGDQLRQLVHALCPSIYGHELVKAGIVLALLGGVRKHTGGAGGPGCQHGDAGARAAAGAGGGRVPVRGDIHMLVVGDPGLGKSQLLQAAAAAAPRGIYVCGNTSTSAGLTVSVVRDAVTGDSVLEAGAVVLSDCGLCCVDEFDKMTSEHQALLEVMEQQEVSVAKAGLVANLPARASILAAANPVGGHYNRAKTLAENLKGTSPAMLSRFDLIFVLLDRPDEQLDQALSEHVMALHSGMADRADKARQRLLQYGSSAVGLLTAGPSASGLGGPSQSYGTQAGFGGGGGGMQAGDPGGGGRVPLSQRLKLSGVEGDNGKLPVPLLKKYVQYARTYCHPRLSEEAKQVLQAFYLQMRAQAVPGSKNPVTARQLESLVRLAEARARAELRPVVERSDAEDVVDLVREALYDRFGADLALGCTDYRAGGGRAGSRGGETARFMSALRRQAERESRCVFSSAELYGLANELSLAVRDVAAFVDQLNESGHLLKRGGGQYKVEGVNLPAASNQGTGSRQKAARLQSANRARTLVQEQEQEESDSGLDVEGGDERGPQEDEPMEAATSSCTATAVREGGRAGGGRGRRKGGAAGKPVRNGGVRAYGQQYGNELMQPEWMTDVPADLGSNWLVMPRPEGMRCLLVTARGRTVSWLRNGAPLHRFHCALPGGSPATAAGCGGAAGSSAAAASGGAGSGDYCLLDCIFHPANNTYYIQDLLCWRGYALYDCAAEFRQFWLAAKLAEEEGGRLRELLGAVQPPPPQQQQQQQPAAAGTGAAAKDGEHAGRRHGPGRGGGAGEKGGAGNGPGGNDDVRMDGGGEDGAVGGGAEDSSASVPTFRIVKLPVQPCTPDGLRAAYGDPSQLLAAAAALAAGAGPGSGRLKDVTMQADADTAGGGAQAATSGQGQSAVGAALSAAPGPALGAAVDFMRDGLYLLHRQGHYVPGPAPSPLALLWKDLGCSRYLMDTDAKGLPLEHQQAILAYRADRTVATEDDPPVVLGRLPEAFVASAGERLQLKTGRLLRFSIKQGGITFHEGRPCGADLHFEGTVPQRRGRADSFSKIMFQRLARTAPVSISDLEAAVVSSAAAESVLGPDAIMA
ncbi:hypothetical protein HYH02_003399 [Chlamydomonas schloesseri]|uniref:Probable DNA helicase MCM8 n=1 Tax=Chlamydomonas schloesseri TaxID=2026947 RepID=A0A835WPF5_9CHLO|nr:hypothetical protein HYH02_003399 [Chlamydomonas schloesseri]|eukprot:KAG2451618.1 hypothetical protein HYH02_003399 [Chlamydomonas schloesseri]